MCHFCQAVRDERAEARVEWESRGLGAIESQNAYSSLIAAGRLSAERAAERLGAERSIEHLHAAAVCSTRTTARRAPPRGRSDHSGHGRRLREN